MPATAIRRLDIEPAADPSGRARRAADPLDPVMEAAELAAAQVRLICTRAWLRDMGETARCTAS